MSKKPYYEWDENLGIAYCTLYYKDLKFIGHAQCHEDDEDMKSKLTGQTIAEIRAMIQYLRHIRDNEIKPKLAALKQFYYSINRSKEYNKKSYESRMLYRQIRNYEKDLDAIKEEIVRITNFMNEYITTKEAQYQLIRQSRKGQN